MYGFADRGGRYSQGEMPSEPGPFDADSSIAILTEIPAEAAPPTYPPPAT